jgi:predicted RNA-binding Zn-ribbon protein involved in translation (DUF1610 family)
MVGVIEHVRPPRCSASGQEVDAMTVSVTKTRGYWSNCPECGKTLWLNKHSSNEVTGALAYTFPEHIGRQEES